MKPGILVAFIANAQIQFGILAAIIRRESLSGDTTQYVVTSIGPDGTANADQTIENEDDVADMDAWNKEDKLLVLALRLEQYQWARNKAKELAEPIAPPAPVEVRARTEPGDAAAAARLKVEDQPF